MRKLFWTDPYQRHLITTVLTVDDNRVLFDDTIAFSFSGGQESDRAYINGLAVIHSEMIGNLIYYILPDNHALTPGDTVAMEIDWPRRYRLMRLHFAAELVLELMTQMFGIKKIGAHIGETKARIDFFTIKIFLISLNMYWLNIMKSSWKTNQLIQVFLILSSNDVFGKFMVFPK
ncbi:hypothetical protein Loa_01351 [Legionella oakridgensis ATCC 33761 = DSM 21215]|uniref:Uncharacterized protein n=1 Tax=Legionella oakridgensis ATCC 33761 = DSM 21215 TaxID=1268635 RepID=W0BER3_9GAMM|nr:hypothetical protein Loa_01351 [Legionella oakridgensis ATCC 33761 = DSM 21215]